jgi:glutaredoxin
MQVTIYSKEDCPYCEKIKTVFNLLNVDFIEYTLDNDFTRENFISEFGENSTFPRVVIDGKLTGGSSETIAYLKEQNLL